MITPPPHQPIDRALADLPPLPPQGDPTLAQEGAPAPQAAAPEELSDSAPKRPRRRLILTHRPKGLAKGLESATATCTMHWSAYASVVPFAVISLVTAAATAKARGMDKVGTVAYLLASVVWGVVAAGAIAWVAWRLKGKSVAAPTISFITALALTAGLGAAGAATRHSAAEATVRALRAKATADVSEAGRHAQLATDHAFDCLKADGGLSLRGVTTMAQLDRRLGLFDDVLRAVRGARQAPEVVQARLHAEMVAARVPPARQLQELAEFRTEVHWDADRRIDDATERLLAAGRNQLTFVRQEWGSGRMKIDRQTGQCTFQDKRAAERFKKLAAQVMTANAALRATVKEAVSEAQARAATGAGTVAVPGTRATGAIAGGAHELTPADAGN